MSPILRSAASSPHSGAIEFSEAVGAPGGGDFKCVARFRLGDEEYSVDLDMIGPYRVDMLGFFEELGREAEGWEGTKEWHSEFDEMTVWATNAGQGSVALDVHIRWPPEYEVEQTGTIHVAADELRRFADRMRGFMRLPEGGDRFRPVEPS